MDVVAGQSQLVEEGEAELMSWLVEDGATVQNGQPIAELETGKATIEVTAPASGTLQITVPAGRVIEPGATIGRIV